MRLLHVTKYALPQRGGMETFVRDLSVEQARSGHDVTVLSHQAPPLRPGCAEQADGVTVMRCATLCSLGFAPLSPALASRLRTRVLHHRPDIVHLHLPNPAAAFLGLIPESIPLVVHWHADVQGSSNKLIRALYPAYRFFEQRCLSRAKAVVTTSPPYLESSPSLAPWRDKCTTVPLGLDACRYPEKDIPSPPRPLVLAVGRLAFYKGFNHLIRAAVQVPEADVIIAGQGTEHAALKAEIRDLGLKDRVFLPGEIAGGQLRHYLQAASLFCLPSVDRAEAFGVSLLEAMRYGLPLVSTAIPGSGTGWVNRDRETGLVVPPGDPDALAEAIRHILSDTEAAHRYGHAARLRLETTFTINRTAQALEKIYAMAMEG